MTLLCAVSLVVDSYVPSKVFIRQSSAHGRSYCPAVMCYFNDWLCLMFLLLSEFLAQWQRTICNVDIRAGWNNWFETVQWVNRFSRADRIEFPSSLICHAVCKAGASSVCLLVTKLTLIALYCNFKQFANILMHIYAYILLNSYVSF